MTEYRPLSLRGTPDPRFDELHVGVPAHLLEPVVRWLSDFLYVRDKRGTYANRAFLEELQLKLLRGERPLDWSGGATAFKGPDGDLEYRLRRSESFALDVVDFCLHHPRYGPSIRDRGQAKVAALNRILEAGGSVWEGTPTPDGEAWMLTRRSVGPVLEAIDAVKAPADRAHHHLVTAWSKVAGRSPDPSGAYREAVRGVEAAARPVITPDDSMATLGKMIRAIRDKPSKWTFALGEPSDVADMAALLWTGQLDRHGTNDESVPLNVSHEQADAAVHLALTLVRYFAGGLFVATEQPGAS